MISELPLVGAGGEPVDLKRTLASHGVASLPPSSIDEETWTLEVTLPSGRGARTVRVSQGRPGYASVEGATKPILAQLRHMLRLDEDLSMFYAVAREDPALAWAAGGAGRMLRSPTVYEDVVKTVCTTNCAWSGTVRQVRAVLLHVASGRKIAFREYSQVVKRVTTTERTKFLGNLSHLASALVLLIRRKPR